MIKSVFFYGPADRLSHASLCLMRGLASFGIKVTANISNFSPDRRGLAYNIFNINDEIETAEWYTDEDFCVIDMGYGVNGKAEELARLPRPCIVDMDDSCNYRYHDCPVVFAAHQNRFCKFKGVRPLVFGPSHDYIALSNMVNLTNKKTKFLRNFTPTLMQSVRDSLSLVFEEKLEQLFEIDRTLTHNHIDLSNQLAVTSCVLAYGGAFVPNLISNEQNQGSLPPWVDKMSCAAPSPPATVVLRWDSWRFWEAAIFGCVPIHLDFEKYGFELPVMPQPWVHYIPIDLTTVNLLPERIESLLREKPDALVEMGMNARNWALTHYNPTECARRLIVAVIEEYAK
jgi:hypothetical protein